MRPLPPRSLTATPPIIRAVLLLALALVVLAALGALITLALAPAALAATEPATDPSVGFPVALGAIALLATGFALAWRTISRRRS